MKITGTLALLLTALWLGGCSNGSNQKSIQLTKEIDSLKTTLDGIMSTNAEVAANLATFDTLDFVVFSNEEWSRLHESHSNDILVHWPDGHTTEGIEKHIEDLKFMFVYAPDTQIKEHPIKIGAEKQTAVIGYMTGTFTEPMPIGDGKFIQPTGKSFRIPMATIGLWNDEGVMYEEYLFWDNQTYMNQLGLGN